MDNHVVVLNNIAVIYEHHFLSIKKAIDAVNSGTAKLELENNGMSVNMFIREKEDVDTKSSC